MRTFTRPASIILLVVFVLSACSKDSIIPTPVPPVGSGGGPTPAPIEKAMVRFATDANLAGEPFHTSNLRAVITVEDDKGQQVLKEKLLSLNLPGPVSTESIELPVGNYKLTSFRMEYGSVFTHFATPVSGSPKASSVQHPLAVDFKVEKNAVNQIPVEVLRVQNGDKPQQYGYPSSAFDYGQEDADPYMKVKMKAIMKIGNIVYDSLPAALTITTWNDKGEMSTTYGHLNAGINEVSILKAATKYQFTMSKWGTGETRTFSRQEIDLNTIYILGSSKDAKKLTSERVYKIVNGADVPESKTQFYYNASGNLSRIDYWLKKQDQTTYLAMTDAFEYANGRATRIVRTDRENQSVITVSSFTYDNAGKVTSIAQNDNGFQTDATVEYFYTSTPEIKVHYTYPSRTFDMNYYMRFRGGNMIESSAATSHHNTELGRNSYDLNINPYVHMRWPNLFLSNNSLHNITSQQKDYSGSYPTAYPYSFNYTYDADGYPTQVIKHFRSPVTGNYVFSTKTVFVY
jgi:hypothetical protein